jgi:hypothetical protein
MTSGMRRTNTQVLEIVNIIEREFPVNSIVYRGIKAWPFIRLLIVEQLVLPGSEKQKKIRGFRRNTSWRKLRWSYRSRNEEKKKWKAYGACQNDRLLQHCDAVLLSETARRNQRMKDCYVNRCIDPYRFYLERTGKKAVTLEYVNSDGNMGKPCSEVYNFHLHSLDAEFGLAKKDFFRTLIGRASVAVPQLKALNVFFTVRFKIDLFLNEDYVSWRMDRVIAYKEVLKVLLGKLRPKNLFLVCFYSDITFASVLACRELGIRSVELQHGQQGDHHLMYTHWAYLPEEGFEMLPDYFWNWGTTSSERISKWSGNKVHKTVAGGNAWIPFWKENYRSQKDHDLRKELDLLAKGRRKVLFTLQPVTDPIPSFILRAIHNTEKDCYWMIRLHPAMKNKEVEIITLLHEAGVSDYDMSVATKADLYELLLATDIHLTLWSSVAYEAYEFGVRTIIAHRNGYEAMKKFCDEGIFRFCECSEDIEEVVRKGFAATDNSDTYIITDANVITATMVQLSA